MAAHTYLLTPKECDHTTSEDAELTEKNLDPSAERKAEKLKSEIAAINSLEVVARERFDIPPPSTYTRWGVQ